MLFFILLLPVLSSAYHALNNDNIYDVEYFGINYLLFCNANKTKQTMKSKNTYNYIFVQEMKITVMSMTMKVALDGNILI